MARYWVFVNYGSEGWKPTDEVHQDFHKAFEDRDKHMGHGSEVVIFKEVEFRVLEKDAESGEI